MQIESRKHVQQKYQIWHVEYQKPFWTIAARTGSNHSVYQQNYELYHLNPRDYLFEPNQFALHTNTKQCNEVVRVHDDVYE